MRLVPPALVRADESHNVVAGVAGRIHVDRLARGDLRAVVALQAQFVIRDFLERGDVPRVIQDELLQEHQGFDMLAAQLQLLGTFKLLQDIRRKGTAVAHGRIVWKKGSKERKFAIIYTA